MIPNQTNPCSCFIQSDKTGVFGFNIQHDYEVYKARKAQGLPCERQREIIDHPLNGKTIIDKNRSKEFKIVKFFEEWHLGWFSKLLLVDENDSHVVIYWDNINCFNQIVVSAIKRNKENWKLVD